MQYIQRLKNKFDFYFKMQNGIIKNHDYTAFDEIQTIVFQEPAEIQAALKSYLESGKTTIDQNEFTSECGLMLMGNIPLTQDHQPLSNKYFDSLPINFRESALLDRFHCFIEGWKMPRIKKDMISAVAPPRTIETHEPSTLLEPKSETRKIQTYILNNCPNT